MINELIIKLNSRAHTSWDNVESQMVNQYSIKATHNKNVIGYITVSIDNGNQYVVTMLDEFRFPIVSKQCTGNEALRSQFVYYGALINRLDEGSYRYAYR